MQMGTAQIVSYLIHGVFAVAFASYAWQFDALSSTQHGLIRYAFDASHPPNHAILRLGWVLGYTSDDWVRLLYLVAGGAAFCLSLPFPDRAKVLLTPVVRAVLTMITVFTYQALAMEVGDLFYSYQWDLLLVEVGVVCIVLELTAEPLAPVADDDAALATTTTNTAGRQHLPSSLEPTVVLNLIRVMAVKLLLMSGIAKLQSGCPTWMMLIATRFHFATQCLPTPLAWYFHNVFPPSVHKWFAAMTLTTQIAISPLLLVPFLSHGAAVLHIGEQVLIAATGNYNFFNVLTIILCLPSLLGWSTAVSMKRLLRSTVCVSLLTVAVIFLSCKVRTRDPFVESRFSHSMFNKWLGSFVPFVVGLIAATTAWAVVADTVQYATLLARRSGARRSVVSTVVVLVQRLPVRCCVLATVLLLTGTHCTRLMDRVLPAHRLEARFDYHTVRYVAGTAKTYIPLAEGSVQSYGLFGRMTGLGSPFKMIPAYNRSVFVARPEMILQGSRHSSGPWETFEFAYKPTDVSATPRFVAPHQPRLDWQMWFAALSEQPPPWFYTLADRILTNTSKMVVDRLGLQPPEKFRTKSPRYVRALRRYYDFSYPDEQVRWWQVVSKEDEVFMPPRSLTTT